MVKLREKPLSGGRVSFYLDVWNEAAQKRTYHFLKLHTPNRKKDKEAYLLARADAEKVRLHFESDAMLDRYGIPNARKLTANIVDYFREWSAEKKNPNYHAALRAFEEFTKGFATFESITPERCEDYQRFLLKRQHSTGGAIVYYRHFVSVLNRAERDGILLQSPAKRASMLIKNAPPMKPYLTFDEVMKLHHTPCDSDEVKACFLFQIFTGLRISDARALTWSDIADGVLTFRIQKTKQPHSVPLIPAAQHILDAQREKPHGETVFKLPPTNVVNGVLKTFAKAAGIEKHIGTHTARRTFASLASQRGVDVATVKTLLGHSTIQMSLRYAQSSVESKREAVMRLQPQNEFLLKA